MLYTALHRLLGLTPGPITDEMIDAAVAGQLAETDDLDWKTRATELVHSSVDARSLVHATREALRVARAADIYLIDLVHDQQDALPDDENRPQLPIYDQP